MRVPLPLFLSSLGSKSREPASATSSLSCCVLGIWGWGAIGLRAEVTGCGLVGVVLTA